VQDNEKYIENPLLQDIKTFGLIYDAMYWDTSPQSWDDNYVRQDSDAVDPIREDRVPEPQ
jgi:hypothetical protein